MQQFYDEITKNLENKANAAETEFKTVMGIYANHIKKFENRLKIGKSVTVNAVKERDEEHKSLQYWIEDLLTHNTKLQDQNELMDKTVKELTDKKYEMGKVIDDQKAQNMEMKQKCQRNIRALAIEKKLKVMVEDELVSLKKKNEE